MAAKTGRRSQTPRPSASPRSALAPDNPSRVYLVTPVDGVFRSDDRGASWAQISTTNLDAVVHGGVLLINPGNTTDLLVASNQGVYRSIDGGVYLDADAASGSRGHRPGSAAVELPDGVRRDQAQDRRHPCRRVSQLRQRRHMARRCRAAPAARFRRCGCEHDDSSRRIRQPGVCVVSAEGSARLHAVSHDRYRVLDRRPDRLESGRPAGNRRALSTASRSPRSSGADCGRTPPTRTISISAARSSGDPPTTAAASRERAASADPARPRTSITTTSPPIRNRRTSSTP